MGIGVNHLVIKFFQKFDNIYVFSLGKERLNNRFWSNYKAIIQSKDIILIDIINLLVVRKVKKYKKKKNLIKILLILKINNNFKPINKKRY